MNNNSQPGKILAIDYGASTVGLAVSDHGQQMVFGRGVMDFKKGQEQLLVQIGQLCDAEKAVAVVVGLPLGEEGQETEQTKRIRTFAERLEPKLGGVPVFFQDESFSSFEAGNFLADMNIKGSNRKQYEDELAAILILKRYLAKMAEEKGPGV